MLEGDFSEINSSLNPSLNQIYHTMELLNMCFITEDIGYKDNRIGLVDCKLESMIKLKQQLNQMKYMINHKNKQTRSKKVVKFDKGKEFSDGLAILANLKHQYSDPDIKKKSEIWSQDETGKNYLTLNVDKFQTESVKFSIKILIKIVKEILEFAKKTEIFVDLRGYNHYLS